MNSKYGRRQWVKLWTHEWLTGTMRFQLSAEERSIWADFLALAGASRYPGTIAAGQTSGKLDPFPRSYLCGVLQISSQSLDSAIDKFLSQDRIKIQNDVISIVNWDRYQSEYLRQVKYRIKAKVTREVTTKNTKTLPVEGEGEGEGEGDKIRKEESRREKKIRVSRSGNGKETFFTRSPLCHFEDFKSALPDWSQDKARYYFDLFIEKEELHPGKYQYANWALAARAWDRKNPFVEKPLDTETYDFRTGYSYTPSE